VLHIFNQERDKMKENNPAHFPSSDETSDIEEDLDESMIKKDSDHEREDFVGLRKQVSAQGAAQLLSGINYEQDYTDPPGENMIDAFSEPRSPKTLIDTQKTSLDSFGLNKGKSRILSQAAPKMRATMIKAFRKGFQNRLNKLNTELKAQVKHTDHKIIHGFWVLPGHYMIFITHEKRASKYWLEMFSYASDEFIDKCELFESKEIVNFKVDICHFRRYVSIIIEEQIFTQH
jgi:hypothetical protein